MAKKNAIEYDCKVYAPGIVTVQGDIIEISKETTTIRHRREGSSKYLLHPILNAKIIMRQGDVGQTGFVRYNDEHVLLAEMTGIVDPSANGFTTIHTDKGDVTVQTSNLEATSVTDEPEENLKFTGKVGNTFKAKKKKEMTPKQKAASAVNLKKGGGKARKIRRDE